MAYGGFEKDRVTLKYRCPAAHYGYECVGQDRCSVGKALGIGIEQERRVFTPLPKVSWGKRNFSLSVSHCHNENWR
jgi:hypothetical protein